MLVNDAGYGTAPIWRRVGLNRSTACSPPTSFRQQIGGRDINAGAEQLEQASEQASIQAPWAGDAG